MPQPRPNSRRSNSPVARALGEEFQDLHEVVRQHYSEPTVSICGRMESIHVNTAIRPLAMLSYMLFRAPVPRGGEDVQFTVHNCIDSSGTMHWLRTFFKNASFDRDATFPSQMTFSGDHRILETTRYGLGVESVVSVDDVGSLVFDIQHYAIRMPFLGIIFRFPIWLSPLGGGHATEIGEAGDSYRVEFEMTHPMFGRTVGYSGTCRISRVNKTPRA